MASEKITIELDKVQSEWLYSLVLNDMSEATEIISKASLDTDCSELEHDVIIANQILNQFPRPVPSTEIFDDVPF